MESAEVVVIVVQGRCGQGSPLISWRRWLVAASLGQMFPESFALVRRQCLLDICIQLVQQAIELLAGSRTELVQARRASLEGRAHLALNPSKASASPPAAARIRARSGSSAGKSAKPHHRTDLSAYRLGQDAVYSL